jgi:uncharacterized membrane protein YecN with MAPEG domain
MTPVIVPAYAGLLTLLYIALAVRVMRLRRSSQIGIGYGGHPLLERRMRVHANFAEYVPLAIILLAFAEVQGRPAWQLHALGGLLLAGRLLHAYGVSQERENISFRAAGILATFAVLVLGALSAFARAVSL